MCVCVFICEEISDYVMSPLSSILRVFRSWVTLVEFMTNEQFVACDDSIKIQPILQWTPKMVLEVTFWQVHIVRLSAFSVPVLLFMFLELLFVCICIIVLMQQLNVQKMN